MFVDGKPTYLCYVLVFVMPSYFLDNEDQNEVYDVVSVSLFNFGVLAFIINKIKACLKTYTKRRNSRKKTKLQA